LDFGFVPSASQSGILRGSDKVAENAAIWRPKWPENYQMKFPPLYVVKLDRFGRQVLWAQPSWFSF